MQSHVVTNDLRQAQGFQRCCQYRDLAGKDCFSLYMLRQALHPHARASSCQEVLYFYSNGFIQQGFQLILFSPLLKRILCIIVLKND